MGTNGYGTPFFKMGATNYWDFNVQVEKKFTRELQMTFMYMNQCLNNQVVPIVETEEKYIHANILVAEAKYKFNKKFTLRGELQYLFTEQDQKDWAFGLVEFSWSPYLMVYVSDQWNCGETGTHYYMTGVTGIYKSNRLALSYGRTRKGYNCSGGLCRPVPAMHGFQINYTYNF
jgi:outer membrane receptor for ferrienterochelin and colicin